MKLSILITLLLVGATFGLDLKAQNSYDPSDKQIQCDPKLPTLAVGDFLMNNAKDFENFKNSNKAYILAVSDSSCEQCCQGEIVLQGLRDALNDDIKIVRVDQRKYQGNLPEEEKLFIDTVPSIYFYYNGYYYSYNDGYIVDLFIDFMNRIANPVIELTTQFEVDAFTDLSRHFEEKSQFTKPTYQRQYDTFQLLKIVNRVVAFVSTPGELGEDMTRLAQAATNLNMRGELRVARCTNPTIIDSYKQKMGQQWFADYSTNSIVLFKRHNGASNPQTTFKYLDIASADMPFYHWINLNSLDTVEELSGTVYKIIMLLKKPFFVAFLSEGGDPQSNELYALITRLAPKYPNIQFTYTNSEFYKQKKPALGVGWKEDPAFTFVFGPAPGQAVPYPKDKPINEASLLEFIEKCYDGSIIPKPPQPPQGVEKQAQPRRSFEDVCLAEGTDVLLFIYDSTMDPRPINEIGPQFAKAGRRFQELGINTVKLTQYDSRGQSLPNGIGPKENLPQVLFFPAHHKQMPYASFTEFSTEALMLRVQAEADIKFGLPENFQYTREDLEYMERANDL